MAVLWHGLLALGCILGAVVSQDTLKTTANGFLQDSQDPFDPDLLSDLNKKLEEELDPEVLDDLKEWNEDILSKLNFEEAKEGDYGQLARDNPLGFLSLVNAMPKEEKLEFLKSLGEDIQKQTGQACNMYGGKEACMTLPADSDFARLCPEHDLKVDCAYYTEDIQEIQADPIASLKTALQTASEADIEDACPECFENQRRMFCFTALPKCGSFSAQVETAILPAAEAVAAAVEEGKDTLAALAQGAPYITKAMASALPCREMCEALVKTCSCGNSKTLGELRNMRVSEMLGIEQVPAGFSDQLGSLQNVTLCDLYTRSTDEGFVGHCEVLAAQNVDFWYDILKSWSPGTFDTMADVAESPDVKALEDGYIWAGDPPPKQAARGGLLVGILVGAVVTTILFAGAFAAVFLVLQRRKRAGQTPVQYVAMTESDSLLQPPTAEL